MMRSISIHYIIWRLHNIRDIVSNIMIVQKDHRWGGAVVYILIFRLVVHFMRLAVLFLANNHFLQGPFYILCNPFLFIAPLLQMGGDYSLIYYV